MRRTSQLITQIRRETENERVDVDDGISDDEIIQYLNNGQERIESMIAKKHKTIFSTEKIIDLVSGQEEYALDIDNFIDQHISVVEYSFTGREDDYNPIKKASLIERLTFPGYPSQYIPRRNSILINPIPDQVGKLRVSSNLRRPKLDKRRAVVDTIILDTTNRKITAMTFQTTGELTLDSGDFDLYDRISVCDADGNIQMRNIPVSVAADGNVTVRADFVYDVGESISSGNYVTLGKYSTTTSQLPEICEKYLIAYGAWRVLKRDSSVDSSESQAELSAIETDIIDAFAENTSDIDRIPIINSNYLW